VCRAYLIPDSGACLFVRFRCNYYWIYFGFQEQEELFQYLEVEDILRLKSKNVSTRGWMSQIDDEDVCNHMRRLTQHKVVEVTDPAAVENTYASCAPSMDSFMREDSEDFDNQSSVPSNRSCFTNFDITLDETKQSFIADRSLLERFKNKYCHSIRKLQISWNGKFQTQQEFDFYQSMSKLEHLVVELIDKLEAPCYHLSTRFPMEPMKNLQILEIQHCDDMNYFMKVLQVCPNLEHLGIPTFPNRRNNCEEDFSMQLLGHLQSSNGSNIKELSGNIANFLCLSPLKSWNATEPDYRLFTYIEERHIKLIRFDANVLTMIFIQDSERSTTTISSIVSLEGIVDELQKFAMPNLVGLYDEEGSWTWEICLEDNEVEEENNRQTIIGMLSRLRSLKIIYNSSDKDNKELLNMLMGNYGTCSSLEDLNISIGKKISVSVLPSIDWSASFPSLKTLEFKSAKLEGLGQTLCSLSRIPTIHSLTFVSDSEDNDNDEIGLLSEAEFQALVLMRGCNYLMINVNVLYITNYYFEYLS
jgi:hypothetical protein